MEKKNEKEIIIKIDGEEWQKLIDDAFKRANKKAKIPGFRPGKASRDIFVRHYGIESLLYDASDKAINIAYDKLLEENADLNIVARPTVDIDSIDEEEVSFKFILTLKPEVKLGEYKKLKAKKEEVKVTDEEIEHSIDHMREHYKENILKDGAIENGDIAIIDFKGLKDGVAFDGGTAENYSLEIGSGTFIPGFEEQLIGLKAGDEKEINVTFPEDYHAEDLKGQAVVFEVKINEVKEVKIPELDKDFFEDLGMEGIDSKEALEAQVKENIMAQKEKKADDEWIDALLEEASSNMEVEIPEIMIKEEVERMIDEYGHNLEMQGITLEQFYQFTGMNEDKLKEEYHNQAEKRVKYRLLVSAIIENEKIEVSDEEVNAELEKIVDKYKMDKDEFLKQFGGLEMVRNDVEVKKVFDILKGQA